MGTPKRGASLLFVLKKLLFPLTKRKTIDSKTEIKLESNFTELPVVPPYRSRIQPSLG